MLRPPKAVKRRLCVDLPIPVGRQLHQVAKALLAVLHRQLGLLACRDVLHDRDVVQRPARRVALHGDRQVHPHGRAVLAQIALLHRERRDLARAQLGAHLVGDVLVVGVRHLLDGEPEQLVAAVAEELAHPRVHMDVAAGVADIGDADRRQLDRRGMAPLALAQRRLRLRAQAELADLAADVACAVEQLGIELVRPSAVQLDHADHAARGRDRERERAPQSGIGGERGALERGLGHHVVEPHRLTGRPSAPHQAALSGRQADLRHAFDKGADRAAGLAPHAHAQERAGGAVFHPAGAAGPAELFAHRAHQQRRGFVQIGRSGQRVGDTVFDRQPLRIARAQAGHAVGARGVVAAQFGKDRFIVVGRCDLLHGWPRGSCIGIGSRRDELEGLGALARQGGVR